MQQMIGKIAGMYPMMIVMGLMIVLISFSIGYANSQTAADYFARPKAVREYTLMDQRASMERTGLWLPAFRFVGLGLILGGIVMALRVISDSFWGAGTQVLYNLPADKRPQMPGAPWYGLLMPVMLLLGKAVFLVAFGVSLWPASLAPSVLGDNMQLLRLLSTENGASCL